MTRYVDRLGQLSLEEKAALTSGSDVWNTEPIGRADIPAVMLTDGPHGLRKHAGPADRVGLLNSVPATCFPTAAALASSWDPDLLERVGVALGTESRAERVAVLLGPGVNIKRSPLCGRNFEYFSEDPVLAGDLAAAYVRGVQSVGVGTSVKHFAANNQEADRMRVSAEIDPRTLREIYLPAFERVVTTARPWTVMCSYNRLNGIYASEHPWLLTDLLRGEWGFDGLVVSDWGAVNDRVRGLAAGLDLEMPSSRGVTDAEIVTAVRAGDLDASVVDRAARRVLELLDRTADAVRTGGEFDVDAHHDLARRVAAQCAVLLKNEGGLLPLAAAGAGRVAVIGAFAEDPRYQGAGSSLVNPTRLPTPLAALRAVAGAGTTISYSPGYAVDDRRTAGIDQPLIDEAVRAARNADVVILMVGLPSSFESEGYDRSDLDLPPQQVALIDAVKAVNSRVIAVLSNGSAVRMSAWDDGIPAVLEGWLLGQGGSEALADLLFGVAAPSGRLAETIPLRLEDTPAFGNFPGEHQIVHYGEGLLVGYRWYDTRSMPVSYPFGHGLTYTEFSFADAGATVVGEGAQTSVTVSVAVTNVGVRSGCEVVQVYVHDVEASVFRPEQELKAFAKVALEPGQAERVEFTLNARDLSFFHAGLARWVVESGTFDVRIGASSRDIRATCTVAVVGDSVQPPLDENATLGEFLANPVVGPELVRAFAGEDSITGGDESMLAMLSGIPMSRLARFPSMRLEPADIAGLVARAHAG